MTLIRSLSQTYGHVRNSLAYNQSLCRSCLRVNQLNRSNWSQTVWNKTTDAAPRLASKSPTKLHYNRLLNSNITERVYDRLILFTRILHKQSNVYLSLQFHRFKQTCTLYYRLYSPQDFRIAFLENIFGQFRSWLWRRVLELRKNVKASKYLMGFVACSAFSWEDNRITDEELNELIKEFVLYENSSLAEKFSGNGNNEESCEDSVNDTINNDGFMVVNCLESSKKSIENWEEVINRPDFHVWRRPVNNSSLYQYKVYGSYTDISAFSFYSVVRDLDYRKEWDKLVLKLEIVETEPKAICAKVSPEVDDSGNELIYWVMKYPYPMKNREYVYLRRSRVDYRNKFIILLSRSVHYPKLVETQDNVRVYDYVSQMVIKPHDESFYDYGFDYMLTYFDDPRASFPSPAYNWMASRGVPEFVETLHQAALKLFTTKQRNLVVNRANNSSDCVWLKPKDRNDFVVNASSENTEQSSEPQSDPTADSPVNPAENQPDENESREPLYRRFKTLHNWN